MGQPPSGGCVLKLFAIVTAGAASNQPPSGGCVLKRQRWSENQQQRIQPPSGGCVLKLRNVLQFGLPYPSRLQAAVC